MFYKFNKKISLIVLIFSINCFCMQQKDNPSYQYCCTLMQNGPLMNFYLKERNKSYFKKLDELKIANKDNLIIKNILDLFYQYPINQYPNKNSTLSNARNNFIKNINNILKNFSSKNNDQADQARYFLTNNKGYFICNFEACNIPNSFSFLYEEVSYNENKNEFFIDQFILEDYSLRNPKSFIQYLWSILQKEYINRKAISISIKSLSKSEIPKEIRKEIVKEMIEFISPFHAQNNMLLDYFLRKYQLNYFLKKYQLKF